MVALAVALVCAGLVLVGGDAAAAGPPRIMPIGDSTTAGIGSKPDDAAYRTSVETRMISAGRTFDFVGSGSKGPPELFDKDNEGHGGFRINDVDAGLAAWFAANPPDIVTLMIGTNDVRSGPVAELPSLPGRLAAVLDHIHTLRPQTHVIVASIPPQPDLAPPLFAAERAPALTAYNNAIPGIVANRSAWASFADVFGALGPGDIADGSHPTAAGHVKVAGVFYGALTPMVPVTRVGVDYLGELDPVPPATNGFGPYERNRSNGGSAAGDGTPIRIKGVTYGRGLGTVPVASLNYPLGGGYDRFMATVGLDDVVAPHGSVRFRVFLDNDVSPVFDSGLMLSSSTPKVIDVSVAGRSTLKLLVNDGGDGANYDHADWGGARLLKGGSPPVTTSSTTTVPGPTTTSSTTTTTLPASTTTSSTPPTPPTTTTTTSVPSGSTVFVSDLTPTAATNGYGPYEQNRSNGGAAAGDGGPLRIKSVVYAKGLGTVPAASITYSLAGSYGRFLATVGIDDIAKPNGSVVFQVFTDGGTKLYDSGTVTWNTSPVAIDVSVAGRATLRLVVTDAGDGTAWDHADWGNARLTSAAGGPTTTVGPTTTAGPTTTSPTTTSAHHHDDVDNHHRPRSDHHLQHDHHHAPGVDHHHVVHAADHHHHHVVHHHVDHAADHHHHDERPFRLHRLRQRPHPHRRHQWVRPLRAEPFQRRGGGGRRRTAADQERRVRQGPGHRAGGVDHLTRWGVLRPVPGHRRHRRHRQAERIGGLPGLHRRRRPSCTTRGRSPGTPARWPSTSPSPAGPRSVSWSPTPATEPPGTTPTGPTPA